MSSENNNEGNSPGTHPNVPNIGSPTASSPNGTFAAIVGSEAVKVEQPKDSTAEKPEQLEVARKSTKASFSPSVAPQKVYPESVDDDEMLPVVDKPLSRKGTKTGGFKGSLASLGSGMSSMTNVDKNEIWVQLEAFYKKCVQWYNKNVSYRLEFMLYLILLIPFAIVILALSQLATMVFYSKTLAATYQSATSNSSQCCLLVSDKYSIVKTVHRFAMNRGTVQDIYNAHTVPGNRFLLYTSIAFYVLSVSKIPYKTPLGPGLAFEMAADPAAYIAVWGDADVHPVLSIGLGSRISCSGCGSIITDKYTLTPLSKVLKASLLVSTTAIADSVQDIIAMEIACNTLSDTFPITFSTNYVGIYIDLVRKTTEGFAFQMFLTSRNPNTGVLASRICQVHGHDMKGKVSIKYDINEFHVATRVDVVDIQPYDPDTCENYYDACLNVADRPGLGYALFSYLFGANTTLGMMQPFSWNAGLFPDPSDDTIMDDEYENQMLLGLQGLLMSGAIHLLTQQAYVDLYTDQNGILVKVPESISIAAIVTAGLCILTAFGIYVIEYFQLEHVSDRLLKEIDARVRVGKLQTEALANLAEQSFAAKSKTWTTDPIKYLTLWKTI
ncbi:hypothetical protein EDD86DRAFT_244633 [Gorgonomyces haynaldii]|nr:hypothetical protein EDD86DRAFT_244633 [Gorgonomyces haynaldii]